MTLPDAGPAQQAPPVTAAPDPGLPASPGKAVGVAVRVGGAVVSVIAVLVTAALEIFLAPLHVGGVLLGAAAVLALVANAAIGWFAVYTVGSRWAVGPPWAVWTAVMFFAVGMRTGEGDQLVAGDNWVGLVMILLGSLSFALYAYRLILRGHPPN